MPDPTPDPVPASRAPGSPQEPQAPSTGAGPLHGPTASMHLFRPPAALRHESPPPHRHAEKPGDHIGPFKLLELLGEGGFGAVWAAEQTHPLKRRVALKLLNPGMDTKTVLARFEQERQALAMMDHPNIARVLDAGVTAAGEGSPGRPYFVMELVRGVPITQFCDSAKLTPRQRMELMQQVARAVQHAHTKGIIHRDIKPGNVLVTLHGDTTVPKVIDFGIAKATTQPLTDKTIYTEFRQLIGTPPYMSPEQAEMSGLDIDTRTDIYALGALTYELLTGSPPLDPDALRKAGIAEVYRLIKESEPPKPSTKVSTIGGRLREVATGRGTEPGKLSALLRGEPDWIVMKAMEKDRSRRYETAEALAADIGRYLSGEAVLAGPPSAAYRARRFVRKHRVGVGIGAVVLLALITAIGGLWWGLDASRRQTRVAEFEIYLSRLLEARSLAPRYGVEAVIPMLNAPGATAVAEEHRRWAAWECARSTAVRHRAALRPRLPDGADICTSGGCFAPKVVPPFYLEQEPGLQRAVFSPLSGPAFALDIETGRLIQPYDFVPTDRYSVAIEDGRTLSIDLSGRAANDAQRELQLHAADRSLLHTLRFRSPLQLVRFNATLGCAVVAELDGRLHRIQVESDSLRATHAVETGSVSVLDARLLEHRNAVELVTADLVLLEYSLEATPGTRRIKAHEFGTRRIQFSPSGRRVLTMGYDGTAVAWSSTDWSALARIDARRGLNWLNSQSGHGVFLDENSAILSNTLSEAGYWSIVRPGDTMPKVDFPGPTTVMARVETPAGVGIAAVSGYWDRANGHQVHWQPPGGKPQLLTVERDYPYAMAALGDEQVLFVGLHSATSERYPRNHVGVRMWDLATRTEAGLLITRCGEVRDLDVSPDKRFLAVSFRDGSVEIWDWRWRKLLQRLSIGRGGTDNAIIPGLDFHPGGGMLATACHDGRITLWSTTTWRELARIDASHEQSVSYGDTRFKGIVKEVRFSPDGRWLLAAVRDELWVIDLREQDDAVAAMLR